MNTDLIQRKCEVLMEGYRNHYAESEYKAISVEQTRVLPIVNPETNRTSRTFRHAGKTDCIVTGYGKTMLMDHKTCSEDITDPDAPYWKRLAIDSQISKYTLQEWQAGVQLDGFIYDVIRKPTISPKKLAKKTRQEIIVSKSYFYREVSQETLEDITLRGLENENLELYGYRLADDIANNPTKYYQRRNIPRLDNEIIEYATELWQIANEIRKAKNDDLWFRNSDSCMNYNRPCEFLGVCSGHDSIDSDNWQRIENVHEELETDGDGRELITNSSIKCFQTCRRKFKFKYVDGIRRNNDEQEALYFGSVLHEMLEHYWLETMETDNDDSDQTSVSGVECGQHVTSEADGFSW